VIAIDRDRRTVTLAGAPRTELRYDQLVLCAGSRAEIPAGAEGVHGDHRQAAALARAVATLRATPPGC